MTSRRNSSRRARRTLRWLWWNRIRWIWSNLADDTRLIYELVSGDNAGTGKWDQSSCRP